MDGAADKKRGQDGGMPTPLPPITELLFKCQRPSVHVSIYRAGGARGGDFTPATDNMFLSSQVR